MAHWTRVITEKDAPEWTSVLHPDGSISEVKVSLDDYDVMHVHVDKADGKRCTVTGIDY